MAERSVGRILFAAGLGQIVVTMTVSSINLAFPVMAKEFSVDMSVISWLSLIYMLSNAGLLLIFGRMGDLFGNKRLFVLGFVIFTVSALLMAVFSKNLTTLIVLRGVQSVGAAMTMAVINAIITGSVPISMRGQALGFNGIMVSVGLAVGPGVGGLLIRYFGWVSIFWFTMIVGLLVVVVSVKVLNKDARVQALPPDIQGAVTWLGCVVFLLFGLQRGSAWGYLSPGIIGSFAISVICLLLFLRAESRSVNPLIPLGLFKNMEFALNSAGIAISFMAQYIIIFLTPFYLADVKNVPSDISGLIILIHPATMMLVAGFSGRASDRWGHRPLTAAGLAVSTLTLFFMRGLGASSGLPYVYAGLLGIGLGSALYTSPGNSAVMGAVTKDQTGIASGMVATGRALGQTLGVTLAGNVVGVRTLYYAQRMTGDREIYVLAQGDAFLAGAALTGLMLLIMAAFRLRQAAGGRKGFGLQGK
jgi:EmrB/QacA subfamily drug resistance transporter